MFDSGHDLSTLFVLNDCTSRRVSSYDRSGGNFDWIDLEPGEERRIAEITKPGVIRHIWCTMSVGNEGLAGMEYGYLRKIVLRAWWDGEEHPSVEAPIGDFFGIGHGIRRNFVSGPLSMGPSDGLSFNCWFPMPFESAVFSVLNECAGTLHLYFYIDYEEVRTLGEDWGRFHAQWRREAVTGGWAAPGDLSKQAAADGYPAWYPSAWLKTNTSGADNYVILEAEGRGKYVGCNLNVDVFERQANEWYGEGDDMIFIDGEHWPPSLHGTGTEDYFNLAECPAEEFCTPWHGITVYSGREGLGKWGGKNSMYRFHVPDPIHFIKSIRVTIEHGHANKLSNDYSSTAYWYQTEPHKPFPGLPSTAERLPRKDS